MQTGWTGRNWNIACVDDTHERDAAAPLHSTHTLLSYTQDVSSVPNILQLLLPIIVLGTTVK